MSSVSPENMSEVMTEQFEPEVALTSSDTAYLTGMNDELSRLDEYGMLDGVSLVTDDIERFGKDEDAQEGLYGAYRPGTAELYINSDPSTDKQFQNYSTRDEYGALWHELAHHRVRMENPQHTFDDEWGLDTFRAHAEKNGGEEALRALLQTEVGTYGANYGPMEFMAEVFSGMIDGQTYAPPVMALYRDLGGPSVPVELIVEGHVDTMMNIQEEVTSEVEQAIEREINDREFRMVVPKFDNDHRPIKSERVEEVAHRISERFGGVTIFPTVAGCWIIDEGPREGELMCEENLVITAVRDSEDGVSYKKDVEWMKDLAGSVADTFGQFSVMVSEDVVEADFVAGEYRDRLDDDNIGRNVFRSLL